jgi:hypothetical protein
LSCSGICLMIAAGTPLLFLLHMLQWLQRFEALSIYDSSGRCSYFRQCAQKHICCRCTSCCDESLYEVFAD